MTQLEDFRMNVRGANADARHLLSSALGFAQASDASVAGAGSRPLSSQHAVVLTFILAQAAELAMKAYLVERGVPLSEIAGKPFGHDLDSVLQEAKSRGFAPKGELPARWFAMLNDAYKGSKQLQYPNVDGFVLPSLRSIREMVEALVVAAAEAVTGAADPNTDGVSIGFGATYPGVSIAEANGQNP